MIGITTVVISQSPYSIPCFSQESGIRNQESGIRNQESGIRNQESGIRDQESGVRIQNVLFVTISTLHIQFYDYILHLSVIIVHNQ